MIELNFSISELIYSDTAIKHNINNMPDLDSLDNLLNLIFYCLQPIRDKLKKPIIISSGYRCAILNKLVGGVTKSQHTKGQAVDFHVSGMQVRQVIDFIKDNRFEYDQLINEYDKWVHISYNKGRNRRQVLRY